MSRITLTLDDELKAKLEAAARDDDRPMSSVARLALAKHFGINLSSKKPAKKKGRK